ncbi:hypothetical protein HAX54_021110, partial [Datura stramonium]|nr:hypothetical protein [Datura stramonium]
MGCAWPWMELFPPTVADPGWWKQGEEVRLVVVHGGCCEGKGRENRGCDVWLEQWCFSAGFGGFPASERREGKGERRLCEATPIGEGKKMRGWIRELGVKGNIKG